jgi:hypothetical protein
MSAAKIHREFCAVYGHNVMSERPVRRWCRMLKDGKQMFTMKSEVVGRPFIENGDLHSVDQIFSKDGASRFQKSL